MPGLIISVEGRYCTAVFTHPAIRRVYKMASHGGAGQSREKQSLNRATVFFIVYGLEKIYLTQAIQEHSSAAAIRK